MAGNLQDLSDWGGWDEYDPTRWRSLHDMKEFPRETYRGPIYEPPNDILKMRNAPFRDGFPTEFSALLGFQSTSQIMTGTASSSDDIRNDYLWGLMVGSIIILALFVFWCAVLILLKCCGRKRVGCASGVPRKPPARPVPKPAAATSSSAGIELDGKEGFVSETTKAADTADEDGEYELALAKYDSEKRKFDRMVLLTRVGFLLAGFFVIMGSVLFYVKGIGSLINSLKSVQGTLTLSDDVLSSATFAMDVYVNSSSSLRESRELFQSELDQNCSDVNLPPGNGLEEIVNSLKDVRSALNELSKGIEAMAGGIRDDLVDVQNSVNSMNEGLDNAYPFLYAAIGISIVLIIITLLLMISVVLAWKRQKVRNCFVRCMKNAVVLPIFILFMILAWLFATLFMFAAIGGADFCVDPDDNTIATLQYIQKNSVAEEGAGNLIFALLKFYVSGCDDKHFPKPTGWEDEISLIETVVDAVHDLLEYFTTMEGLIGIQTLCDTGGNAFASLNSTATVLHGRLHILWISFIAVYEIISCKTMNPLYSTVAYEGICANATSGLIWIFSTQLTIALCCMAMVTLRAAAKEIEDDVEAENNEILAVGQNILVPSVSVDVAPEVSPNPTGSGEAESVGVERAAEEVEVTKESFEKASLS
uniref:Uncharacterized protein n=1 Tax=Odontella aurita TaxID=265563 RepID=A0A7S4JLT1_9STRA|mmetsp:Transcript_49189/g.148043  ORF Transcript_49189/g.148043 Transcript_49189/m.148043 type:complete len:647 (+) Transcript_49189:256-2196(+)